MVFSTFRTPHCTRVRRLLTVVSSAVMGLHLLAWSSSAQDVTVPSFQNDVQPVLSRYGCNSGGCHGKLAGQNGFRLSLRGYAPEEDFASLVSGELGRRVNSFAPDKSLLLLKATARIPHGGGRLFDVDSDAYQVLRDWIAAGAPRAVSTDPEVMAICATPASLVMQPGEQQPIRVNATYSDGSQRDVTWLSRFQSNDAAYASVRDDGMVRAERHGEVALVVSFQGQVDTVVVTIPYPQENFDPQQSLAREYAAPKHWIDQHVQAKLRSLRIPPSERCDDAAFLRRVTLDLTGTLPTPDEVRGFLADEHPDKRERMVDHLLERPEFVEYWTLQLSDLLQNRKERDHDVRGVKGVRAMHAWIREQVAKNRPWDELVRDVITATGPSDQNPAVGYFIVTVGEKSAPESEVGDSVAQSFLGTRIGCARCHNHPLEKYTQDDYYHFMAFFAQLQLDRKPPTEGATVLKVEGRELRDLNRRLQHEQQELTKLESAEPIDQQQVDAKRQRIAQTHQEIEQARLRPPTVRQPRTGEQLGAQGLNRVAAQITPGSDPRVALADWMTDPANRAFSGAMINRLWKHFFAVGLVEAVDDLRDTNPPSNQPLYDALIDDFVASDFDLRHVMRQIVTSETYQRASTTTPHNELDAKFYSHYYAKRLPAEVLLDAIVNATGIPDSFPGYPLGTRAKQLPGPQIDSYFLTTFGRSDRVTACACERSDDVTLPQLLHLQNSESLLEKLRHPDGTLQRLLDSHAAEDALIDELYLATLSRLPSDPERQELLRAFSQAARGEVALDLFWALLNSKEFAFNH